MKKVSFAMLFILLGILYTGCHHLVSREPKPLAIEGNILEDFESGSLESWKIVSGNLHQQPVKATRRGIEFYQEGEYFIGTTETGGPNIRDFDDKVVGVIRSGKFTIENNFISLLVGGGQNEDNLYIALVRAEDGYIIHKATGKDSEEMKRIYWDVSDHLGESAYFKIVDNSKGGWGHINVDDIRVTDTYNRKSFTPLVIAGEFSRIYNPSIGEEESWYINDHCFIPGADGAWHLFGITHADPANPLDEDNFAHATSEILTRFPWEKHDYALSVVEDPWNEFHLWAPHVIKHDGTYYMYYCCGDEDHDTYKIHLATSEDLWSWERHEKNPMVIDGYAARDPMILKLGNEWIMYYTANSEPTGGNHIVACRTSTDLINWGERKTVFTDPKIGKGGGPTESPFVVQRDDLYYLFIGPRGGYVGTDVFVSKDPFHWDLENKVGHIDSHAAEVIRDRDGKWYVSHCGWGKGGVYLAPLYWNDGKGSLEKTSLPVPGR